MKNITEKFESIEKTYEHLKEYIFVNHISVFMEIATTAAAIVTQDDNVYYGVNIKGDCGLGFCAERNALSTMLTAGETKVKYVLCIDRTLSPRLPCGACREYMPQINAENMDAKIVTNLSPLKFITLKSLLPDWWGYEKIERKNKNKK